MLVLKNRSRIFSFLFLLICSPLWIYSDDSSESSDLKNGRTEVLENAMSTQHKILWNKSTKKTCKKQAELSYYLYVEDFAKSFIDIPTSNVFEESSTKSSKYLAGRAVIYNERGDKAGTCSASFLCMKNKSGIFTDISNYLSIDNGLIVTWFTPTTLINLEVDSIVHSMVTECIVIASTKVGFNPFYGKTFNMIVSSDDKKIYFKLTEI